MQIVGIIENHPFHDAMAVTVGMSTKKIVQLLFLGRGQSVIIRIQKFDHSDVLGVVHLLPE
jgi:hypothetical protein